MPNPVGKAIKKTMTKEIFLVFENVFFRINNEMKTERMQSARKIIVAATHPVPTFTKLMVSKSK